MPNRDKTGPEGKGSKTGRGAGSCEDGRPQGRPAGRGAGRRPRRDGGRRSDRRA
ncbi:DUF5320 domain-containing protein [Patescibacteria group bacterium]